MPTATADTGVAAVVSVVMDQQKSTSSGSHSDDTSVGDASAPRELDDEELDLVGGGFQLHTDPSEDEPFDSGLY
jgi:hypothetical protein